MIDRFESLNRSPRFTSSYAILLTALLCSGHEQLIRSLCHPATPNLRLRCRGCCRRGGLNRRDLRGSKPPLALLFYEYAHVTVGATDVRAVREPSLHVCMAYQDGGIAVDAHLHILRFD